MFKVFTVLCLSFVLSSCAQGPNYAKETLEKRGKSNFKIHQEHIELQEAHREKVLKFARDKKEVSVDKKCKKYQAGSFCMGDYFLLKSRDGGIYESYELTGFYNEAPVEGLKKPYPPYLFPLESFKESSSDLKKDEVEHWDVSSLRGNKILNRFKNNKLENLRLSIKKKKCAVNYCYKMSVYQNGSIEALDSWIVDISNKLKSFVRIKSISIGRAAGSFYSTERLLPVKIPYYQKGEVTDAVFLKVRYQTYSNKTYDLMVYPTEGEISGQRYKFKRKIGGIEMSEKNFNKILRWVIEAGPGFVTMDLAL